MPQHARAPWGLGAPGAAELLAPRRAVVCSLATPAACCAVPADTYLRTIVPIGGLYAGTLWLGNAAYLYLSVSFIQMLKVCCLGWAAAPEHCSAARRSVGHPAQSAAAGTKPPWSAAPVSQATMPVAVFTIGCLFGTEHYTACELGGVLCGGLPPGALHSVPPHAGCTDCWVVALWCPCMLARTAWHRRAMRQPILCPGCCACPSPSARLLNMVVITIGVAIASFGGQPARCFAVSGRYTRISGCSLARLTLRACPDLWRP